ncbi:MAG: TauD/TfdA family dioxygenase [Burkholderiales bacterium]
MSDGKLVIKPLPVGGEVSGLAPGDEADPAVREALYAAWLEYGFLLFRNVDSIEQHLALSQCFGELAIHPMPEVRSKLNPHLINIGGVQRNATYVFDEKEMLVNRIPWHRDTAYVPDICRGSMLRMVEPPLREGETMVADTAMAYDDLPNDVKDMLERLEYKATLRLSPINQTRPGAFWKKARLATLEEDPDNPGSEDNPAVLARYPSVIYPALLIHPESNRKCIFISPTYVDYFLGMTQSESDELLAYLTDHMLKPRYVYKHRWLANDALIWDNWRCLHAGMGNRPNEPRSGLRTTLAGLLRMGRYFDASPAGEPAPMLAD